MSCMKEVRWHSIAAHIKVNFRCHVHPGKFEFAHISCLEKLGGIQLQHTAKSTLIVLYIWQRTSGT